MKKNLYYYSVIFVIILLLISTLLIENNLASRITTIITLSTALIGAGALFVQYKRDKDVNQASFIVEYAKYFYSLNGVEDTMNLLDEYRLGNKSAIEKISYNGIINYLFWCEELSSLVQKNIIDIQTIDNLFSYTFFLITNNKYIQEKELIPQAEFYKGIYYLHNIWTNYKIKTNQPIINSDESLNKVSFYEEYSKKGDIYNKNFY